MKNDFALDLDIRIFTNYAHYDTGCELLLMRSRTFLVLLLAAMHGVSCTNAAFAQGYDQSQQYQQGGGAGAGAFSQQAQYPQGYPQQYQQQDPQQGQYAQQSQYPQQAQQSQYPQQAQQSQYPQQGQYSQQSQYPQQGQYAQQSQYPPQGQYAQQSQYPQQGQYSQQMQYPQQGQQSQYPQQAGAGAQEPTYYGYATDQQPGAQNPQYGQQAQQPTNLSDYLNQSDQQGTQPSNEHAQRSEGSGKGAAILSAAKGLAGVAGTVATGYFLSKAAQKQAQQGGVPIMPNGYGYGAPYGGMPYGGGGYGMPYGGGGYGMPYGGVNPMGASVMTGLNSLLGR